MNVVLPVTILVLCAVLLFMVWNMIEAWRFRARMLAIVERKIERDTRLIVLMEHARARMDALSDEIERDTRSHPTEDERMERLQIQVDVLGRAAHG